PAAAPKREEQKKPEPEKAPEEPAPAPQAKAAAASAQPQPTVDNGRGPQAATAVSGRMIVSPLAARMAAEAGIDLRSLQGSGPGGRIIKRDIEAALSQPKAQAATPLRLVESPQVGASAYRDEPATEIRKVIAKRLVTSL